MTRRWTLDAARELLPEVRDRTARAVEVVERLEEERALHDERSPERQQIESRLQEAVGRWARQMEALGLEVKGLWLVDFDTGGGYYCWKWPEERLDFFHGYEDGFAGRTRIH
jgi:hypothetical protein